MEKLYLTTSIPYVNAAPHIGHALEFVQADTLARFYRLRGFRVALLSGSDENAIKNVQAAERAGETIQAFIDRHAKLFQDLANKLNVQFDFFQKGSDKVRHYPASQKLWRLCAKAGDIYKKAYKGPYCVGCEAFYNPEDLDSNLQCPEHPGLKLEEVAEENYFFRLSKYGPFLHDLISQNQLAIIPEHYKNEALALIKRGLEDISISRSNQRAKNWGVPVPGDPDQRMYVWFDALNIYQSGVGFGWNEKLYQEWWPADIHIIGKGINRFHSIYWPAFLKSANLALPKKIFVHGYLTVGGQKISKTLGNIIDPQTIIQKYSPDALRYYLLKEVPAYGDGDFSEKRLVEIYNGELANGLGNLFSRLTTLANNTSFSPPKSTLQFQPQVVKALEAFEFNLAIKSIWSQITKVDQYLNEEKPWAAQGQKRQRVVLKALEQLANIAYNLQPFLPQAATIVLEKITGRIQKQPPLFPRLEASNNQ